MSKVQPFTSCMWHHNTWSSLANFRRQGTTY